MRLIKLQNLVQELVYNSYRDWILKHTQIIIYENNEYQLFNLWTNFDENVKLTEVLLEKIDINTRESIWGTSVTILNWYHNNIEVLEL
ncbi:hypothetical protein [Fusobacterium phage Fnu1]|uniref:Uncharacterized protein n=1 Tax=Fusobacterium phage Fnu1 TaxID=2530024 RepID=A0A481W5P7_9CAUD|nr:hypothetical protein KMD24_gp074 [Fusobacterium phage Fnu1]QBJ04197.1 hypothetical protein [Fusobacterium phage Fnu1]